VFVSCSTLCFARQPLEEALRVIAELEFAKVDVAIHSGSRQLAPADVAADLQRVYRRLRLTSNLMPAAFDLDIDPTDPETFDREFRACCKLARQLTVATLALPAAPCGSDFDAETARLRRLVGIAGGDGLVLTVVTRIGTLTELPESAVRLCQRVPGLGLTLDPSHYICGPNQNRCYDIVFPYVKHVHLRDSGRTPDKMQVRVGQGELEYSKMVSQLERCRYDRLLSVEIMDQPNLPFVMESEVRKLKYLLESLA
jgi:sugar phosphate isomerase/epimerase